MKTKFSIFNKMLFIIYGNANINGKQKKKILQRDVLIYRTLKKQRMKRVVLNEWCFKRRLYKKDSRKRKPTLVISDENILNEHRDFSFDKNSGIFNGSGKVEDDKKIGSLDVCESGLKDDVVFLNVEGKNDNASDNVDINDVNMKEKANNDGLNKISDSFLVKLKKFDGCNSSNIVKFSDCNKNLQKNVKEENFLHCKNGENTDEFDILNHKIVFTKINMKNAIKARTKSDEICVDETKSSDVNDKLHNENEFLQPTGSKNSLMRTFFTKRYKHKN
ncbi:hypothetical protein EDEG_02333 [Edhazardia aedis USNM 41457]|uniref:Uncharacterized protein n=1 Tax=Edhazardia aedis (strain USNM 41457) TaxID=1003232 RepID=J9DL53_EDHAE|nr:hypothetical protein EDEG_02333 [Edhazardia aedis USNM 41457]|eukprot:EJW03325.1 hypothetical protein EDEG_02333 [Edhazardia aedis USNM 41457]